MKCNLYLNTAPAVAVQRIFSVSTAADSLGNAKPQPEIFRRGNALPTSAFCEAKGRALATYIWFGVGAEQEPFTFTSLWRSWKGMYRGKLVKIDTYTILTTRPNALVAQTHPDRMPVILNPDDYERWLTAGPDETAALLKLLLADATTILVYGEGLKALPE